MNARLVTRGLNVEETNPLPVSLTPSPSGVTLANATMTMPSKTVASAGTPEALGTGSFQQVLIFPLRANTGEVWWGLSSVNDAQSGTLPVALVAPPGKLINIADIYLDVAVNGEGVRYFTAI